MIHNMKNNSTTAMAAIESLEERLSLLLQQIDTAAGGETAPFGNENASTNLGVSGEAGDLSGQGSQLLERMEQIVLAAHSSAAAKSAEGATREELRSLSQWLERNFASAKDRSPSSESVLATWQAQLDRIEQQLISLREATPATARFE